MRLSERTAARGLARKIHRALTAPGGVLLAATLALLVPASALAVCGDGALEASESCDDGNTRAGDGCSALCAEEPGFVCNNVGLVRNISFETPVIVGPFMGVMPTNWSPIPGLDIVDIHRSGTPTEGLAPDGQQLVDLNRNSLGGMFQDLPTTAGNTYSLQLFGAINNNCSSTATGRFRAINGTTDLTNITLTSSVSFNSPASAWEQIQLRFTAASATTRLQLTTVSPSGPCGFVVDGLTQLTSFCSAACGNGTVNPGEACDDGNRVDDDTCNNRCLNANGRPCESSADCSSGACVTGLLGARVCGACTDTAPPGGNDQGCGAVRPVCNTAAMPNRCVGCVSNADCRAGFTCDAASNLCVRCGDGRVTGSESCDDGNNTGGDGCNAMCATEPGFTCPAAGGACTRTCPNGMLDVGESCDDNNAVAGDGCSSTCRAELNFTCVGAPSVCSPAVTVTAPANGSFVTTRRPVITGTAPAGSTVSVRIDGGTTVMVTANASGAWTLTPGADLALGSHTVVATVTVGGRTGTAMSTFNVVCSANADCASPTPVCITPGTATAACGACPSGQVFDTTASRCVAPAVALTSPPADMTTRTTNLRFPIRGTGVPGQRVDVTANAAPVCTATVAADGTWTCTPGADLPLGTNTIRALSSGAMSTAVLVVLCSADAQCGGAGRVCDMPSGACVTPACNGNAGSPSSAPCPAATPVCTSPGTPAAACEACPAMQVYNPATRVCVAPAVTLTNPPEGGAASTTERRPSITGTGIPGAMVTVTSGSTTVCVAVVSGAGTWACTPTSDLAIGANTITATSLGRTSSGRLDVRCTLDAQCGAGQVCETTGGLCATPSCLGNAGAMSSADCPAATPVCTAPGSAAAACGACAAGSVYNTATRACVAPAVSLTTPPAGGMSTSTDVRPTIAGTGVPGQTVAVTLDGMALCMAAVRPDGTWTCTPDADLPLGSYAVAATSAGASSTGTLVILCTRDAQCGAGQVCETTGGLCTTPSCLGNAGAMSGADCPAATPVCTAPGSAAAACGACAAGSVYNTATRACVAPAVSLTTPPAGGMSTTTDAMARIEGTGVPGQTVTVTEGAVALCTAVVAADGTWSCTPSVALTTGSHAISAASEGATSAGTLVVLCATSAQCSAPTAVCETTSGACVECVSNETCGAGRVCDTATRACVASASDAGVDAATDAAVDARIDAPADTGRDLRQPGITGNGACNCHTAGSSRGAPRGALAIAVAALGLVAARRRRR